MHLVVADFSGWERGLARTGHLHQPENPVVLADSWALVVFYRCFQRPWLQYERTFLVSSCELVVGIGAFLEGGKAGSCYRHNSCRTTRMWRRALLCGELLLFRVIAFARTCSGGW